MADKWMQDAVPAKNKGAFTREAKDHDEGVQEYARDVLAPGSKASTRTKRRANFARNARKIANRHHGR